MLHGLRLIDIGNHKDTTLRLGPLTAILGPNGAGKTTVLKAIEQLAIRQPRRKQSFAPTIDRGQSISWRLHDPIIRADMGVAVILGCYSSIKFKDLAVARMLCLEEQIVDRGFVGVEIIPNWVVHAERNGSGWMPEDIDLEAFNSAVDQLDEGTSWFPADGYHSDAPLELPVSEKAVDTLKIAKPNLRYLQLSTQLLKRPSHSEAVTPVMADDGTDLASVLAHLMTSDRATFTAIVEAVRKVVPSVKDIRATRCSMTITESRSVTVNKREVPYSEPREVIGQQLRFDMTSGEDLPAERISDGTMLVLAIVTILKTMPGALILLDDLEQGLHPSAQREVIQLIKAMQKDDPEMQVVFTTHSPYIVDELEPENVWVLGLDKEGCAHAKALSEHPNAKRAMEVLTTGEFWSAEGEDWVVPEEK